MANQAPAGVGGPNPAGAGAPVALPFSQELSLSQLATWYVDGPWEYMTIVGPNMTPLGKWLRMSGKAALHLCQLLCIDLS